MHMNLYTNRHVHTHYASANAQKHAYMHTHVHIYVAQNNLRIHTNRPKAADDKSVEPHTPKTGHRNEEINASIQEQQDRT